MSLSPPRQKLSQLDSLAIVTFAAAFVAQLAFNPWDAVVMNKRLLAMLADGGFLEVILDALPFGCHAA